MALSQSALLEVLDALKASDSTDVIRQALQVMLQQLIDAEATAFIGAEPHERTDARITQRNGTRSKTITTAAGDLDLSITKLRTGSFFPSLLERRRRIDQALFAVIMEAYVTGTSVRKVDDLVKALGADTGISKSEVSRICADLDEQVAASPTATCPRPRSRTCSSTPPTARPGSVAPGTARVPGWCPKRSWSPPASAPTGVVRSSGSPSATPRTARSGPRSCASLKARGLAGTKLVISDAHAGLKAAIAAVMLGAGWQRCRVHFLRNVLAQVPKGSQEMVAAAVRTIFAQPDAEHVREQLDVIATMLGQTVPQGRDDAA